MLIKKSFVNYQGSKYRYIKEIATMLPIFNKGLDLFGGSGVVALNFGLDYNDINPYVTRCYEALEQKTIDSLIAKYCLAEDLKFYAKKGARVSTEHYGRLVTDLKKDTENLYLQFLVKFFAHSMSSLRAEVSSGDAGKFRHPKIINQKLFLNRNITHKSFVDIDLNSYDFVFIDPPYLSGDKRLLYGGWSIQNEQDLIDKLATYKGKFLMTNYSNEYLAAAISKHGWYTKKIATKMTSANFHKYKKAEYFVYNYKVGLDLFR